MESVNAKTGKAQLSTKARAQILSSLVRLIAQGGLLQLPFAMSECAPQLLCDLFIG